MMGSLRKMESLTDLLKTHRTTSPSDPLVAFINFSLVLGYQDQYLTTKSGPGLACDRSLQFNVT
jgi:hypothetical protein